MRVPAYMRRLTFSLLVGTLVCVAGGSLTTRSTVEAGPTVLGCPAAPVVLDSGVYVVNQPCTLTGGITLQGTAILFVIGTNLVVDGNISLRGDAALVIRQSVLTIANHFVQEHQIEARDRATLALIASELLTNAGTTTTSLAAQYRGYDDSRLRITDSRIEVQRSWLLADFYDRSVLQTTNSTNLPTETYPHDSATVLIEGGGAHGIWLEFLAGSRATLEDIPDQRVPFSFDFGRNTPGVVNVGYQVRVINGVAGFGIVSHPTSDVTLKNNRGPVVIGYFFQDVDAPESLTVLPSLRNATLTHQGRTLRLVNASLQGFGWQIYGANPDEASPHVVRIADSTINELGAMQAAKFLVENSVIQFAVVAALGPNSSIEINRSTINAQSLLAEKTGILKIEASEVFGALVQARDDARILLLNTALKQNVCHAKCLPQCPAHANGGCNPFNSPNADTRFQVDGRAQIVVLNLDPVAQSIKVGETHVFTGDVFVQRAPDSPVAYTYDLRYRPVASEATVPIPKGGLGLPQKATLGSLNSSGLAAGDYVAELQLSISGTPVAMVERPFTVVNP